MPVSAIPVLTYHGYNVSGSDYADNDHVALAEDICWLAEHGWTIVPLAQAVSSLFYRADLELPSRCICLTFDDGTDLDWQDVRFGSLGFQRGFAGILRDACHAYPDMPSPHATSFVIASPRARSLMSTGALRHGHGMSEGWWVAAERSGVMSIGNHSWDHRHPLVVSSDDGGGDFLTVNSDPKATLQVIRSGAYIAAQTNIWPRLFAYPWGQASDYLRFEFFPARRSEHGCWAAFGTEPEHMHAGSDIWYLPRYVCGQHWKSTADLAELLG